MLPSAVADYWGSLMFDYVVQAPRHCFSGVRSPGRVGTTSLSGPPPPHSGILSRGDYENPL
jgi:hypothetical protein